MNRQKTIAKVLKLKGFVREQFEAEFRKTNDKLVVEKAKLDHLKDTFRSTVARFNNQDNGLLCTCDVDIFCNYLSHIDRQTEEQEKVILGLLAELEVKKKALLEAHREKRLFEKLQDKVILEDMRETLLVEQKDSDFNFISRKSRG